MGVAAALVLKSIKRELLRIFDKLKLNSLVDIDAHMFVGEQDISVLEMMQIIDAEALKGLTGQSQKVRAGQGCEAALRPLSWRPRHNRAFYLC